MFNVLILTLAYEIKHKLVKICRLHKTIVFRERTNKTVQKCMRSQKFFYE